MASTAAAVAAAAAAAVVRVMLSLIQQKWKMMVESILAGETGKCVSEGKGRGKKVGQQQPAAVETAVVICSADALDEVGE
jgi:hypothetical protein